MKRSTHTDSKRQETQPIRAGLAAGSVAAIAAALVNIPLEAPADAYFNSGPVMVGALSVGAGGGVLWRAMDSRGMRQWAVFHTVHWLVFAVVAIAALVGETQMERSISYILPLAGIVFGLTGFLTPLLARPGASPPRMATALMVILAVGLGVALAGRGDQESGRLELPPRSAPWTTSESHPLQG